MRIKAFKDMKYVFNFIKDKCYPSISYPNIKNS